MLVISRVNSLKGGYLLVRCTYEFLILFKIVEYPGLI